MSRQRGTPLMMVRSEGVSSFRMFCTSTRSMDFERTVAYSVIMSSLLLYKRVIARLFRNIYRASFFHLLRPSVKYKDIYFLNKHN